MNATSKPAKYTTEQVKEIIDRIVTLRTRWLCVVETQLASRQGLSAERAPALKQARVSLSLPPLGLSSFDA